MKAAILLLLVLLVQNGIRAAEKGKRRNNNNNDSAFHIYRAFHLIFSAVLLFSFGAASRHLSLLFFSIIPISL
jgi:hypothetical protein